MLRLLRPNSVVVCLGLISAGLSASEAWSQAGGGQTPPPVTGTVTSVETKGRNTTMKFTDEAGNAYEFAINPKVDLEIQSTGDEEFLTPGSFVEIEAIESNDNFFGNKFRVFPQYTGRPQPAKAVKAPPAPGRSMNLHYITGEIVRFEDKGDEKYHKLYLKVNPKTQQLVYLETDHRVLVVMSDPSSIEEGAPASVVGRIVGTRLVPSKITIETGKTLDADEVLPTLGKKK